MQERFVGTIVVVVLGVVLIPLWLDGPDAPAGVSRDLPEAAGARSQTIRLDAEKQPPVVPSSTAPAATTLPAPPAEAPQADTPAAARADAATLPEKKDPVAAGPAVPASPPAAPAAAGDWAVQVGSFTSADNAEKLAATLKARGFPAFVSAHEAAGRRLLRVRVGPAPDRRDAETLAARLEQAGQSTEIVRHP